MKRAKKAKAKPKKKPRRLTAETRAIIKRGNFLRKLLSGFGAELSGFDPGVAARIPNEPKGSIGYDGSGWAGEGLNFSGLAWSWLEPLLVELRDYRDWKARP